MKKSLLALAVLGAFAGAASAQSSVTLYGIVDANLGKDIGDASKRMSQGASSRLGFRGVEDLGGGLQGIFQLEHRFRPWNGTINGGNGVNGSLFTMWQARSYVGLQGGFGNVRLGREYDAAFFHSEVVADPWGWDTVVSSLTLPITAGTAANYFNVNRQVIFNSANMGGFSFSGSIAESNDNCGASTLQGTVNQINGVTTVAPVFGTCRNRPYALGASYAAGPLSVGVGYNNPGNDNDYYAGIRASYDFGGFKLWGYYGQGDDTAKNRVRSGMVAATMALGQGELRAMYGKRSNTVNGFGLGYHYALSKRTTLYADFARNSRAAAERTGYDFGVKHAF